MTRTTWGALLAVWLLAPMAQAQEASESPSPPAVASDTSAASEAEPATTSEASADRATEGEVEPEVEHDVGGVDVDAESEVEPEAESEVAPAPPTACPRTSRQLGPSSAPLLDGMLGVPRRACFRTEVALAGDAYLIAEPANFYGNIRVGGRLAGSVNIDDLVEIWGTFEALRYQSLISAVSSSYLGTGYLTLGSSARLAADTERRWVLWGRVVLPTTSGLDRNSQPLALELGTTGEWNAHPNLRLHAALSVLGSIGVSGIAPVLPRGGVRAMGGADWIPYEWLSFQLEVQTGFGYRDGLDFVALSGGARLGLGDRIGIDLSVLWPFLGAERALAAAQVGVSGRFDDP